MCTYVYYSQTHDHWPSNVLQFCLWKKKQLITWHLIQSSSPVSKAQLLYCTIYSLIINNYLLCSATSHITVTVSYNKQTLAFSCLHSFLASVMQKWSQTLNYLLLPIIKITLQYVACLIWTPDELLIENNRIILTLLPSCWFCKIVFTHSGSL